MSTPIETLEAKIRAQARKMLKERIEQAGRLLSKEMQDAGEFTVPVISVAPLGERSKISSWTAFSALKEGLFEALAPVVEQKAVDAFLTRLDELEAQVEELKGNLP